MSVATYAKTWKPWVTTAVTEIFNKYPRTSVGTYPGHDPTIARACDFMIPDWQTAAGKAYGKKVADYAWKNSKRLGIWYVIWNGRIISNTRPSQGWLPYFDRNNPNPSRAHKNHVHVSWYGSAPKGWTEPVTPKPGPATTPTPAPVADYPKPASAVVYLDKLTPGQKGSDSVFWVQKALGVPLTGNYDAATVEAVKAFQKALGDDDVDGDLGPLQTEALFAKHEDMQITIEKEA